MDDVLIEYANEISINIKNDGVYLSIKREESSPKPSRTEVMALIESYGVADVDFVQLNEALKSDSTDIDIKISDNTKIIQVDESGVVEASKDRMSAFLTLSAPVNRGRFLTRDDIIELIKKANVVNFDENKIDAILKNRRYNVQLLIGEGKNPVSGVDGYLQYHFDRSNLKPKPKIMDDGTVNFRQLGLLRLCNRGDVLVTTVAPVPGEDGEDVYGKPIPYPRLKQAANIPKGKNTIISEDGLHLIADVSGQLVLGEGKINISPTLEIPANVDNSTGDIEFNGEVTIRGNVVSGFTVKALGNIEVFGVCEAATLITEGNIVLANGAQGADKAVLNAGRDITAKFIEGCTVSAGGNIIADSIMKSKVKCDGSVTLAGKNGLLVGGTLTAGDKLVARTIGSPMGTSTEIQVGGSPKVLTQHQEKVDDYNKLKAEFDKSDQAINTLNALKQRNLLTDDKKTLLLKMINTKMLIREKMTILQEEIDELVKMLTSNSGSVAVSKVIRPGVRVTIGNAQLAIRDDMQNCKLWNNGAKIAVGPNI
jgi:hypothetical protein